MNTHDRRSFLARTVGAGVAATGAPWLAASGTAAARDKQRIKVGQIGIGHNHASAKMATFRKLADHYEVVGVVEPSPEWRKKRGEDPAYRGLTWMTEEQLLNTQGLAVVAVETDVCDLVPTAARCVEAGLHLHLDKPGGETLAPFNALLDEAARRALTVQLGYMYRNNPAICFCQRAVREGWLGQIFEVHAVMSRYQPLAYRQWLGQFRGGSMYIFGCHLIDLVVTMLGKPDRITPFQRQTHPDVPVYDNGLAVLEYPRSTATIRTASLEVEGYQRRQLVVCGDQGTIEIRPLETFDLRPPRPLKLNLTLSSPRESFAKGVQEVVFPPQSGRYADQLIELARIVRGEIVNPYPLSHERMVQETLLGAIDHPPLGQEAGET